MWPDRRRDLARAWTILALLALAAGLDAVRPLGLETSRAFLWGLFSFLGSAIGWFLHAAGSAAWAVLSHAVAIMGAAIVKIGAALKSGLWGLGRALSGVGSTLKRFWDSVLRPALRKLDDALTRLGAWLRKLFRPVYELLEKIKSHVLALYTRYIRPIVDAIDIARRVLRAFATLGFEWARRLDAELGKIENYLELPLRWVLQRINAIEGWLNRIVTLDGYLQRMTLLSSLWKYRRGVTDQFWSAQTKGISSTERKRILEGVELPTDEELEAPVRAFLAAPSGPADPLIDEYVQDFEQWSRSV